MPRSFRAVMRRAVGGALRKVALGGWAVVALLALPVTPTALAHVHHTGGSQAHAGGPRGEGHPARLTHGQSDGREADGVRGDPAAQDGQTPPPAPAPSTDPPEPAPPAPEPAAAPQIEIGTALGPVGGVTGAASATGEAAAQRDSGARRVARLSFDAPSPFAPRSLAGGLHAAPGAKLVQVAIRRGGQRHGCAWWTPHTARFTAARRSRCSAPHWMTAALRRTAAGWRWRATLGGALAAGNYRFLVRVLDADGHPLAFRQV